VAQVCGIAGFLDPSAVSSATEATARVEAMNRAIAHRGPDESGTFVDAAAGIALGHRRLSIIDLSPLGHQPMTSADGRYVVTYNGEAYNFAELRSELDALGHRFHGGTDTEVILAAFVAWGVERAVTRFVGMLAAGVWTGKHGRSISYATASASSRCTGAAIKACCCSGRSSRR
jgi:asparagine synthase (glutamine-hydrolysing)